MEHGTAVTRGWIVTLAGVGINLALGVLYAWSVIAKTLTAEWGWSAGTASLPYAVGVGTFALTMVFAGRAQDRFGPRVVATLGGALTGLGLIVSGFAGPGQVPLMVLGFGLLSGAGIGLGYAAATPAAVKWFPPERKGLITGLVVSGFGLASVYIAPVTSSLLGGVGVNTTFFILGGSFLVVTVGLAQLLSDPPPGFRPGTPAELSVVAGGPETPAPVVTDEYDWHEMIRTRQFVLLWLMYACSAFAGLMIIGHMARIAAEQLTGVELGFILVAVLAVGNAAGRIIAGVVSDRIGGLKTMLGVFVFQAVLMLVLPSAVAPVSLAVAAAFVGFCYGANLSLFPSTTAGFFGTKNLGVNYGLVFTAWGMGGVFGSMTAGTIVDSTGSYAIAYTVAAVLCLIAAGLSFLTKPPAPRAVVGVERKSLRTAA
jgi:OFA family oxalate/formate antiporter-like MFS transporter